MKTIRENKSTPFYYNLCIAMIWLIVFYSSIIQYKVREIPYGMLILGIAIVVFYFLHSSGKPYNIHEQLTEESIWMILFMVYMFSIGTLFAIKRTSHFSQSINSLQYLFVMVIMASLIKGSGTDSFHIMLLIKAIVLAVIFILNPVYYEADRYSISRDLNPNGLGMAFATGIWAAFYLQQKRKLPIILLFALIAIFGFCIFQTGSRKSLVAAGLTIVLWFLFCYLPEIKHKGAFSIVISFLFIIVLLIFVGWVFTGLYAGSTISNRMNRLFYETTEGNRSQMYRAGLDMIKTNPLFGIGFTGFEAIYGLYSHATIVEIPVSGGVVGAIIYFYAYFVSIKKTFCLYRKTKGARESMQAHNKIKMIMILWATMLFYCTCIIHQYQFDSFIIFGIIFGETSFIEKTISDKLAHSNSKEIGMRYIIPSNKKEIYKKTTIGSKYFNYGKD